MKKLTIKMMVAELMTLGAKDDKALLNMSHAEVLRILEHKRADADLIQKPLKNEEKKMTKFKMTENFVVDTKDMVHGKLGKQTKYAAATPAVEAVPGVKGVEAVEAVKADKKAGIEAVKAVAGIKAVASIAAVPAKPEVLESSEIYIKCKTLEIAHEVCARIQDQGHTINYDDMIFEEGGYHCFSFTTTAKADDPKGTAMKMWRAVVKACKLKSGYNAPGLAALAAAAKAKSDADKAAAKAAEPKKEAPAEKGNPIKTAKVEETEEGDGWPEEFEE